MSSKHAARGTGQRRPSLKGQAQPIAVKNYPNTPTWRTWSPELDFEDGEPRENIANEPISQA